MKVLKFVCKVIGEIPWLVILRILDASSWGRLHAGMVSHREACSSYINICGTSVMFENAAEHKV